MHVQTPKTEIQHKLEHTESLLSTYPNISLRSLICKLYRYEKDTDSWSDSQDNQITVNAVFGDVRRVRLKKRYFDEFQLTLFSGSILILSGKIQTEENSAQYLEVISYNLYATVVFVIRTPPTIRETRRSSIRTK